MNQTAKTEAIMKTETDRKNTSLEYFRLVNEVKFKEGLAFFAPDCKTHNPYIFGSIENLVNAMIAANKDISAQTREPEFTVKHVLADGDLVAVHTELMNSKTKPSEGGLRQVHLFRFEGDKIAEYWDITQQVLPNMPNASGAF